MSCASRAARTSLLPNHKLLIIYFFMAPPSRTFSEERGAMKKYLLLGLLKILMNQKEKRRRSYGYRGYGYADDVSVVDRSGHEIFREYRPKKPNYFRFAKIAVVAAVVLTVTMGGLAIWGVVSALNYAGGMLKSSPVAESVVSGDWQAQVNSFAAAEGQLNQGAAKAAAILSQPITTEACLGRLQGLLNPYNWLTVPIASKWQNVKSACLERS
jgi:hypothetical protein